MKRVVVVSALALLSLSAPGMAAVPSPQPPMPVRGDLVLDSRGVGSDYALVERGAQAPDFSFEAQGRDLRLHDLRAQGHVLLVIEPEDDRLVALERERGRLLSLGVVPVAVMDLRPGACAALARRLSLSYALIPDPTHVIAAQFNALDPSSRADAPAWFVLDRAGRVKDLARREWPSRPWTEVTSLALGLPELDSASPAAAPGRRR